ncbi:MAG: hypothetical protein WBX17_05190 [Microbacterium sp.]
MTDTIFSVVTVDVLAVTFDREARRVRYGIHRRPAPPFEGQLALPGVLIHSGERLVSAAERALQKLGVEARPTAIGQLRTFDEPARDPRGPSLSVAMWATYPPLLIGDETGESQWVELGAPVPLAFDHTTIVAAASALLPTLLWRDLEFTRGLTGPQFSATDAVAITTQLAGAEVHRANLNRDLARIPGLVPAGTATATGGRPAKLWAWV